MQTNDLTRARLRQLAEAKPQDARVWSFFLNLDPSEFATAQARASEVRSVVDQGRRRLDREDGLSHDEKVALREDLERVDQFLQAELDTSGAHAVALFVSGPARLFEVLKLPRPVPTRVEIDNSPFIEPLAGLVSSGGWAVLLVNSRSGRLLLGSSSRLTEDDDFREDVRGGRDEGAGTRSRDQHAVDAAIRDHVKSVTELLFQRSQLKPFQRLLVSSETQVSSELESRLHPSLRDRVAGSFDVDVENASPEQVRLAAAPAMEDEDRRRERQALDKLAGGLDAPSGRAAAGLDDVLFALYERRVETLLFDEGFGAPGVVCPRCGWVGTSEEDCPVDGGTLERREDIVETAIEMALTQSADAVPVRYHDDLSGRGRIAALLRF